MPGYIDLTDIPAVTPAELWPVVKLTIGIDLIELLPRPLTQVQIDAVLDAFWSAHKGSGAQGLAVSHRMVAMLQCLARRRFASLINQRPRQALHAAVDAAATLRLNPVWGFNAMRFAAALHAAAECPQRPSSPPPGDLAGPLEGETSVQRHAKDCAACDGRRVAEPDALVAADGNCNATRKIRTKMTSGINPV